MYLVARLKDNVEVKSQCGYACAGKDVMLSCVPLCKYAQCRGEQLVPGCQWRREYGVVERVDPHDDVEQKR